MKVKLLGVALGAALTIGGASAQLAFYGGDFDGLSSGLRSVKNGFFVQDARTYDDFTIGAAGGIVTSVFGNFLTNITLPAGLYYEIRSGVSAGNPGTLLTSGQGLAVALPTGRGTLGFSEFNVSTVLTTPVTLQGGTYHLTVAVVGTGDDDQDAYLSTTRGANGIGSPINNGNSFFTRPDQGLNFVAAESQAGVGNNDFSIGVVTAPIPVPEPATLAALGLGAVAVLRRRRKS